MNCDIHEELCNTWKINKWVEKFEIILVFTDFSIKNMEKLLDMMEDDDDVQNVWHNWDQD